MEQVRKFFVRTRQSMLSAGAQDKVKRWGCAVRESRCNIGEETNKWLNGVAKLQYVTKRFRRVQIEHRDFRFIFKSYDTPDILFYGDSPYHSQLCSNVNYEFDFNNQDHHNLRHYAGKVKGLAAVSFFACLALW